MRKRRRRRRRKRKRKRRRKGKRRRKKGTPKPDPAVAKVAPLPVGWQKAVDPASGRQYFYHATLGTSWIRPTTSE